MTAPDHTTKPLENILRERGHPYMDTIIEPLFRDLSSNIEINARRPSA